MKLLAVIPSRYQSVRFPGKPLALIAGKPMIQRVYEAVQAAALFDKVVVATDDQRILDCVKSFGAEVFLSQRPHPSGTSRCIEVAENYKMEFDFVVNIQGDEPFVKSEQLKSVCELLKSSNAEIASLYKNSESKKDFLNENIVKLVCNSLGEAMYFSRSPIPFQKTAISFKKHIGIYGFKIGTLLRLKELPESTYSKCERLEQLQWLEEGIKIAVAETAFETIGIDTPEDLNKANELFNELY